MIGVVEAPKAEKVGNAWSKLDKDVQAREWAENAVAELEAKRVDAVRASGLKPNDDQLRRAVTLATERLGDAKVRLEVATFAEREEMERIPAAKRAALLARLAELDTLISAERYGTMVAEPVAALVALQAKVAEAVAAYDKRDAEIAAEHATLITEAKSIASNLRIEFDRYQPGIGRNVLRLEPKYATGIALRSALRANADASGIALNVRVYLTPAALPKDGTISYGDGPSPYTL